MNKEKIEKQLSDIDMEILSDLKRNLAEEMSKPTDKRDENLITELEDMISKTEEEVISASKKRSLESVMKMLDEYEEPKHIKIYKRLSVATACLLIVIGLNTASLNVFGKNFIRKKVFPENYQLNRGSIIISVDQSDDGDNSASSSDPYGMKAKCVEYGFFPDTPSYIPEGFVLEDSDADSNDQYDSIQFFYKKGNVKLNFLFTNYKSNATILPIGLPTDTYNVTEEQVNGRTTYILNEDFQFTAVFIDKRIEYSIFTDGLDYDECQKILESMS